MCRRATALPLGGLYSCEWIVSNPVCILSLEVDPALCTADAMVLLQTALRVFSPYFFTLFGSSVEEESSSSYPRLGVEAMQSSVFSLP